MERSEFNIDAIMEEVKMNSEHVLMEEREKEGQERKKKIRRSSYLTGL